MPTYKNIHIVINPAAGQDKPILNTLNRVFKDTGIRWQVSVTHQPGDGTQQTRDALEKGVDLVVACGGDGTVMEVANGLIGKETPMAILPGGTGNAKSVELNIPQNLQEAAKLICNPKAKLRKVDVGETDGRYFVLNAGAGFVVDMMKADRELKDRFGGLAYLITAMRSLGERQQDHYRVTLDNETLEENAFMVFIANSGTIGTTKLSLSNKIDPSDGKLDVFILKKNPSSLLSIAASVLRLEVLAENFIHRQTETVTLDTPDNPQYIQMDGELLDLKTPVTFKTLRSALTVLVPGS